MPTLTEQKTVQDPILKYAQEIGSAFVPRAEAEKRREFKGNGNSISERAENASLYFDNLLFDKVHEFNHARASGRI